MKLMQRTHRTSILQGLLGAVLIGGMVGSAALAEGEADPNETESTQRLSTFTFEGGTIREYIAAIHLATEDANIVADDEVLAFKVPSMELNSIDVESLLWLLENTTGDWNNEAYACDVVRHDSGDSVVYRLDGFPQRGQTSRTRSGNRVIPPAPALMTTVTSVAHTIEMGMPSADIISAMELALEVKGHAGDEMTITYHAPTRLVILNGPSPAISTCTDVLDQVRVSAQSMTFAEDTDDEPEASADRTKLVTSDH